MQTVVIEVFETESARDDGKNAIEKHEVTTKKQLSGKVLEIGKKATKAGRTVYLGYRRKETNHFVGVYKNAAQLLA